MKAEKFRERVNRTYKFLEEKKPGTALWLRPNVKLCDEGIGDHWVRRLTEQDVSELLNPRLIEEWNDVFFDRIRAKYSELYLWDDDWLPTHELDFGQGSNISALCGVPARFFSKTSWCDPKISDWEMLENLKFDPDNVWIQFFRLVIQDMVRRWEGDFCLHPFLHRSPMDAANGLRGNDLFLDCYDEPQRVTNLVMRCADWSIDFERYMKKEINWPADMPRGIWGMALPDDCVFVNGDPVDLVSAEHQAMFDRPSTSRLFTQTGGGFFHHHALGIRQVGNVAETEGMVAQHVDTDPKITPPFLQMLKDEKIAQMFIEASLKAPIYIIGDYANYIDEIIPILEQGCFILSDRSIDGYDACSRKLEKFRV